MVRFATILRLVVLLGWIHVLDAFAPPLPRVTGTFGVQRSILILEAKKKKRRRRKKPLASQSAAPVASEPASLPKEATVVAEAAKEETVTPPKAEAAPRVEVVENVDVTVEEEKPISEEKVAEPEEEPAVEEVTAAKEETVAAEESVKEVKAVAEEVATEVKEEKEIITSKEVEATVTEVAATPPPAPKKVSSMPKDLQDVADFKFDPDAKVSFEAEDVLAFQDDVPDSEDLDDAVSLPDMKELRKTKELEKALQQLEEEKLAQKPKIKRSDTKAFNKLLETNPYIDADDSFFEEEEYGTVEALLGERAKPFLGLPTGPLQVGHFVGALAIALMAFVEYPGFPLTNLPTPLRSCFQGGLGMVYAINTVLAVLAVFKAMERGQSPFLWAAKTFSVGGLAYDQLTQLPTLEQQEKVKNKKGARSLQNRKKK